MMVVQNHQRSNNDYNEKWRRWKGEEKRGCALSGCIISSLYHTLKSFTFLFCWWKFFAIEKVSDKFNRFVGWWWLKVIIASVYWMDHIRSMILIYWLSSVQTVILSINLDTENGNNQSLLNAWNHQQNTKLDDYLFIVSISMFPSKHMRCEAS